ncbi:hypothetical protein SAMN02949497_2352 [Methylomagnum ishizawai]|uniref:Uncharacterized protein n=1 Tax=Methylomagnum ishizawai TaxID=1760988 RepID=A0A1Y6D390_9GAMM|nr:hypothetical protein [Methylomagnum ishizawai]SMF95012.1 hypothetical protein SAMN02949497_2352 [Methylomagnum ishizawai]
MNKVDLLNLLGERSTLQKMIASTPEEDVLDRSSLLARLEEVEDEIGQAQVDEHEPARACLTFSGRPVVGGSHGIFADFAMKAVNGFTEAVAAVAASLTAPLSAMGPIPNREQNQLLITNTALGSFGFELEEYRVRQMPLDEQTPVELALERTQNLLQGSIEPDDELLADSAAELDPRALDKIRGFVNTLAENEAVCALRFGNKVFQFTDIKQVRRSWERLSGDNLHEEEKNLTGEFQGILPKRRTFEFRIQESGDVISGKIGPAIINPEDINTHLRQKASITLMVTRVGNGRPRYRLLDNPDWASSDDPKETVN